jgi:hypothetical protein
LNGLSSLERKKMNLSLPIEVANQVLGYLGTRPYQEVFHLIQAIQEAAKPQEEPKEESNG